MEWFGVILEQLAYFFETDTFCEEFHVVLFQADVGQKKVIVFVLVVDASFRANCPFHCILHVFSLHLFKFPKDVHLCGYWWRTPLRLTP